MVKKSSDPCLEPDSDPNSDFLLDLYEANMKHSPDPRKNDKDNASLDLTITWRKLSSSDIPP